MSIWRHSYILTLTLTLTLILTLTLTLGRASNSGLRGRPAFQLYDGSAGDEKAPNPDPNPNSSPNLDPNWSRLRTL